MSKNKEDGNNLSMAKLYFYYAAMNAGKSTVLLQSSYNYRERGMQTLLFTPAIDTRFQYGTICSRIGLSEQAYAFNNSDNLYVLTQEFQLQTQKYSCVLIDEAQFLTREQVYQLTEITDQMSIPVLAYGLRTDFRGELFPGSQFLLAWADELIELKTICHCGRKAIMNMRIDENGQAVVEGEQVLIGGNESYVATCRLHYKLGEAGKTFPRNKLFNKDTNTF
ncbi:TPA: thymidine kinase [Legionella pneumophila]|uniref:Thymidine kinase n=2 Tax=Legionella pneumophila TaxID=446 RepID=A0AAN5PI99_LEGPN|nr:thymidine kinase [Legionella pneumophila subsp. pneumophila ATCC 43290]PYB42710.1 thymidine kinase [Legionella pneumophila]HAT8826395.1 thymidine kinase [Legionella pneumophila subsp. pneumophila]OOD04653.1 thymidine kinase [Legionella pneumophila subsp. pneumophila ATCC 43290]PYB48766.1 thymidine kinase [Legionella pneumophila]